MHRRTWHDVLPVLRCPSAMQWLTAAAWRVLARGSLPAYRLALLLARSIAGQNDMAASLDDERWRGVHNNEGLYGCPSR